MGIKGSLAKIGTKNPSYKHGLSRKSLTYFCPKCGGQMSKGTVKQCRECYYKTLKGAGNPMFGRLKLKKKYYCIDCGKEVSSKLYKRCQSCASKKNWQNSEALKNRNYSGKNNPMFGKKRPEMLGSNNPNWNSELIICPICGQRFYANKSKIKNTKNTCCSLKCSYKLKEVTYKGKRNPNWQDGKSREPYAQNWTEQLKEQIRKRDDYTCQICNKKQKNYNRKLHVHHIDYNKMNCNENNLITLCHKCHMETNYNRDYWTGYFKEGIYVCI